MSTQRENISLEFDGDGLNGARSFTEVTSEDRRRHYKASNTSSPHKNSNDYDGRTTDKTRIQGESFVQCSWMSMEAECR